MYTFSYIQVILCCSVLTFEASPLISGQLCFFYSDDSINGEYRKWLCFESQVINVLKCVSNNKTSSVQILHNVSMHLQKNTDTLKHESEVMLQNKGLIWTPSCSLLGAVKNIVPHCPWLLYIFFFLILLPCICFLHYTSQTRPNYVI